MLYAVYGCCIVPLIDTITPMVVEFDVKLYVLLVPLGLIISLVITAWPGVIQLAPSQNSTSSMSVLNLA